jgi:recombination protein RecA
MAKATTTAPTNKPSNNNSTEDFSQELIRQLNKDHGSNIAFNLASDDAPTEIKRWISTGSRQLDYIIGNRRGGGWAEGRIVEIQAQPGLGKSHLCFAAARSVQQMGGIVVYVDTENATNIDNLSDLGIDISKKFVFVQTACTEEILSVIESTITKARSMTKDVPVIVIWDSVSQSSPKAELEGDYDQNTIGLQARVLSKGMRKIANVIANQKVLLMLVSQQRTKIGVMYGDPTTTSGGMAIPYSASTRIKLTGGKQLEKDGNVIGIEVTAKTIKNKVARPFRECTFQIHFGVGIKEHENIFDFLREHCEKNGAATLEDGSTVEVEGTSAWKTLRIKEKGKAPIEKKFQKSTFDEILENPQYKKYLDGLMDTAYVMKPMQEEHATLKGVNSDSVEEVQAAGALNKSAGDLAAETP